jgi:O-antigen/teichoic acid export membrane protein
VSTPTETVSARRATADVVVQLVAQVGNVALGLVVTALIARQLGTDGFGEWSTIFACVQITGFFSNLFLQEVAIREITANPERESEWLGALISLRGALAVPVMIASIVILLAIGRGSAMRLAGVIVSLTLATGTLSAMTAVFRLRVRNDLAMAVITVQSILWAAAVVAITAGGGGLVPLSIAFTLATTASTLLTAVMARRRARIRLRGSRSGWPLLFKVGASVGLASLITLAYARIDQVLVFELAPHRADAGLYGGLYRILDTASFVPGAVMTTLYPLIAAAIAIDRDRAKRLFQTALDYLAMVSLPVFAFSLVGARPLLRALLGPDFVQASKALPILMAAYIAICWGYVAGNMVIVLELQRRFIWIATLALIVNVGLNVALIPSYGYVAAAWVTLATEATSIALTLREVLRSLEMRPSLWRLSRVVLVSAALCGVLLLVRAAGGGLVPLVATTVVVYPLLLLASRALDWRELRELVLARPA